MTVFCYYWYDRHIHHHFVDVVDVVFVVMTVEMMRVDCCFGCCFDRFLIWKSFRDDEQKTALVP